MRHARQNFQTRYERRKSTRQRTDGERCSLAICSAFLTFASGEGINKNLSLMSPMGRNAQASLRPIRAAVNGTRPGTGLSAERMSARALRAKTDLPGEVVGYKAAHSYPYTLNRRVRVLFSPNTQGLVTPGNGHSPEEGAASRRHQ